MATETFFVVCAVGFELILRQEIEKSWPFLISRSSGSNFTSLPDIKTMKGGVQFECDIFLGLQLNFFLKTATRILIRLDEFNSRNILGFESKLRLLNWEKFIPQGANLKLHFKSVQSRLSIENQIYESLLKIIQKKIKLDLDQQTTIKEIFVRVIDDKVQLSIDTSGEALHRRNYAEHVGSAPLRESIASFLVHSIIRKNALAQTQSVTLYDPMMGSGRILFEAASLHLPNFGRKYGFQGFPSCPKLFLTPHLKKNYFLNFAQVFARYLGSDKDTNMTQVALHNMRNLLEKFELAEGLEKKFNFLSSDFQKLKRLDFGVSSSENLWVLSNPPYGERIPEPESFATNLVLMIERAFHPEKIALLLKAGTYKKQKTSPELSLTEVIPLKNGGLDTEFCIWQRKT